MAFCHAAEVMSSESILCLCMLPPRLSQVLGRDVHNWFVLHVDGKNLPATALDNRRAEVIHADLEAYVLLSAPRAFEFQERGDGMVARRTERIGYTARNNCWKCLNREGGHWHNALFLQQGFQFV